MGVAAALLSISIILAAQNPAAPDWAPVIEKAAEVQRERELPGLAFGIVYNAQPAVAEGFGVADLESKAPVDAGTVFGIGSITKVFTATLLVALRDEGLVRLDDALATHLPPEAAPRPHPEGGTVTLRHLAQHSSGLARLPINMKPAGPADDAYGGYEEGRLLAAVPRTPWDAPPGRRYGYSNFGAALLGHTLGRAAGVSYADLVRTRISEPLGLDATRVALTPGDAGERLATGYDETDPTSRAPWWNLGAMAPAGAVVSSLDDMNRFLAWQMAPERWPDAPIAAASIRETQTPGFLTDDEWESAVGLGWHITRKPWGEVVWHNGGLAGYASFAGFVRREGVGVVLLTNCGRSVTREGFELLERAIEAAHEAAPPVAPELDAARRFAAAIADPVPEDLGGIFHPAFLQGIPTWQMRMLLGAQFIEHGAVTDVAIAPGSEPGEFIGTLTTEKGGPLTITFSIQHRDDPRINFILVGTPEKPAQ